MTRWQQFLDTWKECTKCPLHQTRKSVVLARGSLPCDILFIGEAPGESEDVCGVPFIGPAGKLLDQIVTASLRGRALRCAFTNLIACIPRDPINLTKYTEPPEESIEACTPRLQEFVEIANPKLLVAVGTTAKDFLEPGFKWSISFHKPLPCVDIYHPSYILRINTAQRTLASQRCIVAISQAIDKVFKTVDNSATKR